MIETIRLSEQARTQLMTMKRRTGIQNWNVLCRWGFCLSLAEPSLPPDENIPSDSSVEMSWKTFAGRMEHVYWALLVTRARKDHVDLTDERLNSYFRLHLHRGISYLHSKVTGDVSELLKLVAA